MQHRRIAVGVTEHGVIEGFAGQLQFRQRGLLRREFQLADRRLHWQSKWRSNWKAWPSQKSWSGKGTMPEVRS